MEREAIVCQREKPFYVDTVKVFRDHRYEHKGLDKLWKSHVDKALASEDQSEISPGSVRDQSGISLGSVRD